MQSTRSTQGLWDDDGLASARVDKQLLPLINPNWFRNETHLEVRGPVLGLPPLLGGVTVDCTVM